MDKKCFFVVKKFFKDFSVFFTLNIRVFYKLMVYFFIVHMFLFIYFLYKWTILYVNAFFVCTKSYA